MFCVQLIFKWADISCSTTMGDLYSTVAVWAVVHRCDGAGRREGGALHRRPLRRHQAHRRTHRSVPLPPITHYQMTRLLSIQKNWFSDLDPESDSRISDTKFEPFIMWHHGQKVSKNPTQSQIIASILGRPNLYLEPTSEKCSSVE